MKPIYKTCPSVRRVGILAALLALILRLPVVLADTPAGLNDLKQQIEQKNQEIQQLENDIKQYQENIDEAESTSKTLKDAIALLDRQIKQLNSRITLTQKKISKKELEIKELGFNITDTADSIESRRLELAKLLELLNLKEKDNALQRFFQYKTVSDFFDELEKTKSLNESVQQNYAALKALKTDLENRKATAEKARRDLKNLKNDLVNQKAIQEDSKTDKANLLKATKNQEALYQNLLQDREKRRAEVYNEIRAIESALSQKVDLSTLPAFGRGILLWPIDGGVVTQGFGRTSFARVTDVYRNGFHNGVDFRAQIGTPIRAAESGEVVATGNSDFICPKGSYGKWILIQHPNKLTTLYAHLSLVRVSARQEVGRGDIIGYSGNSGYTTGPHLHFTVYDSRTVELRQSRVCGILPYGGYLDPLDYL